MDTNPPLDRRRSEASPPNRSGRASSRASADRTIPRRSRLLALAALTPFALAACGQGAGGTSAEDSAGSSATSTTSQQPSDATEVAALTPRLVLTYDGGIQVLDATSLDPVGDIALQGFLRINPAGDGRHVMVSTNQGFQVLDTGTWAVPHGDHSHYYTASPVLTGTTYPAKAPGHVIAHAGTTAVFDDATGHVGILDTAHIATGQQEGVLREYTAPSAHHGAALVLEDGTLLVTNGTEEERTGLSALDAEGTLVSSSDRCPGVHGLVVAGGAAVAGCEDGALVYQNGQLTHIDSPDEFGRMGTLVSSPGSPVVLSNYKTDPQTLPSELTQIALIDTEEASITTADVPGYTFRSLARGAQGQVLVLGTDGAIHVIDPQTAETERSIPVIQPWQAPDEWQQPRPTIVTGAGTAYVSDPASQTIYAVDIATGQVWHSAKLSVVPNEIVLVSGSADATHSSHEGTAHDHEGTGHDHEHSAPKEHSEEGHDLDA